MSERIRLTPAMRDLLLEIWQNGSAYPHASPQPTHHPATPWNPSPAPTRKPSKPTRKANNSCKHATAASTP